MLHQRRKIDTIDINHGPTLFIFNTYLCFDKKYRKISKRLLAVLLKLLIYLTIFLSRTTTSRVYINLYKSAEAQNICTNRARPNSVMW